MQKTRGKTEYEEEFEPCQLIDTRIGNVCRIVFIDGKGQKAFVKAVGDPTFIGYLSVERDDGRLLIKVKNPSGSAEKWMPYDREGYEGENLVEVFTGLEETSVDVINYLDLYCKSRENNNNYEVVVTSLQA